MTAARRRAYALSMRHALAISLLVLTACPKKDPPSFDAAPPPAPETPACPPCSAAGPSSFFFVGAYLDSTCAMQPVAHADFTACAPVTLGTAKVMFGKPTKKHKANELAPVSLARQVGAGERLYRKADGACSPYTPTGLKIAPAGCEGKLVCRDANHALACGGCATLPNGCPNYEGARVLALFTE